MCRIRVKCDVQPMSAHGTYGRLLLSSMQNCPYEHDIFDCPVLAGLVENDGKVPESMKDAVLIRLREQGYGENNYIYFI